MAADERQSAAALARALSEVHGVGPKLSYTAFLQRTAQRLPDKPAVIFGERMWTYSQMFDAIGGLAGHLSASYGVRAGQRVALLIDNSDCYQFWYLAVLGMGAVAVPLNTRLTAREIGYQIENAGVVEVVSQARFSPVLAEVGVRWIDGDAVLAASPPRLEIRAVEVETEAPAAIYYTSGTTGQPKGVVHTHRSLIAGTVQGPPAWEYDDVEAVTLAMTPLFHIANHTWFLPVLGIGGTMVISTFKTEAILELVVKRHITHILAVPSMLLMMSEQHASSRQDLSHVRTAAFGASAMPPEKLAEVQRMFPRAGLVHGMGQTESCGTIVTLPSRFAFDKAGSVGVHIDGADVRVVDAADRDVGRNVVGELVTRGPSVMSHYHARPDATAETLAGGWLHTGDLGYLDADGFLFLVDRKKDMIIRGGENIYSSEVENVLVMHPAVLQAAVVPARSELFGEEVFAFVVLKREASEAVAVDEAAIRAHCARYLAGYKVPVGVRFIEAMPQTATGKTQKHVLRGQLPNLSKPEDPARTVSGTP
jgi:acyl-CoA synthetase (AMP-forming)/AMP-acid ligase II